jgi:SAM-dependent methyltransferase
MNTQPLTGERLIPEIFDPLTIIEHLHRYAVVMPYCKGKTVLDIASGEGYGSHLLSEQATHVTGVDIDEQSILQASEKYVRDNLVFKKGAASAIPLPEASVDVVVSFETIEHHDLQEEMMQEIKRVLKKDGLLIISTPDKKQYSDIPGYKNPFHVKELYEEEFRSLLKKYFSRVQLFGQQSGMMSLLFPLENTASELHWSSGNPDKLVTGKHSPALYLIALASEREVDTMPVHVFKDPAYSEQQYKKHAERVVNSIYYKTGHILLAPARWIRSVFQRKR